MNKADKVFIGRSIVTLEESIDHASAEYRRAKDFLSYDDLSGYREELDSMRKDLLFFYKTFCPSVGLTESDVEQLKDEYKNLTIAEVFEVKGTETLTDKDLFNR